jgi:hypothetical protein
LFTTFVSFELGNTGVKVCFLQRPFHLNIRVKAIIGHMPMFPNNVSLGYIDGAFEQAAMLERNNRSNKMRLHCTYRLHGQC